MKISVALKTHFGQSSKSRNQIFLIGALFLIFSALLGCASPSQTSTAWKERQKVIFIKDRCEIKVEGLVDNALSSRFQAVIKDIYELRRECKEITVALNSPGGNLFPGITIGSIIRKNELNTHVHAWSNCGSACATIFIAGKRRSISAVGATLSFHKLRMEPTSNTFGSTSLCIESSHESNIQFESYVGKMLPAQTAAFVTTSIRELACDDVLHLKHVTLIKTGIATATAD